MRSRSKFSRPALVVLTALLTMAATAVAFADTVAPDGDTSAPAAQATLDFGTICASSNNQQSVPVYVKRAGATSSGQVFNSPQDVTISIVGTSNADLTASMGVDNKVSLPSGWSAVANGTLSTDTASSTVTLNTSTIGAYSQTVTYRASGLNTSLSTIDRDIDLTVTADVQNCTPADTTPPVISYVLNPLSPDGANGWYVSNVTLTWTVTENESPGSLVKTGCVDQNITADQQETTYSCSATSDGGSAGPVDVKIKRDATKPYNIAFTGGGLTDGDSYYFGSVPSGPTGCTASDDTSGVDTCTLDNGYSTAVGSHTITATATDLAGNQATATLSYTVLAWTLNGFYQPVDMGSTVWNTVKGGSTVPFKFEIFAGSTELTDTADVTGFTAQAVACPSSGYTADAIEVLATGGSSLRYDTTAGQFVYNWQTPKKPGSCYAVTMTTADGSTLSANFILK